MTNQYKQPIFGCHCETKILLQSNNCVSKQTSSKQHRRNSTTKIFFKEDFIDNNLGKTLIPKSFPTLGLAEPCKISSITESKSNVKHLPDVYKCKSIKQQKIGYIYNPKSSHNHKKSSPCRERPLWRSVI